MEKKNNEGTKSSSSLGDASEISDVTSLGVKAGQKRQSTGDEVKSPMKKSTPHSTNGLSISLKKPSIISIKDKPMQTKKGKIATVFNQDSESEEEEMPLECRMKMRNIGRNTITSSGPNSFNKGKEGFSNNSFKQFELSMKPRNNMEKKTEPT